MVVLTWLGLPVAAPMLASLGFTVGAGRARVGGVVCEAAVAELSWGFDRLAGDAERLGVPTSQMPPPEGPPPVHPNGVDRVDHVVYTVPDLDDAVAAMADVLGLDPRKRTHDMAFFRAGEAVLEVVASAPCPRLWGVALRSPDLDATVEAIRTAGGNAGEPKPAIQGGRIATVRNAGVPLAILELA